MDTKPILFHRRFNQVMIANTLTSFSFYMISALLSTYLTGIGIRISVTGVIIGLFSITALVIRPACGILSDVCNKVTLLRIAALITATGVCSYVLTDSIPLLVFFRVVHGAGFAVCSTAMVALASDYIPDERMGEGIGYVGLGQVISSAVAPGIGIAIADYAGIKATFFMAGIMSAAVFGFMMLLPADTRRISRNKRKAFSFKDMIATEVIPFAVIAGVFSFMNGMISTYLVPFGKSIGIENVSLYFTICAVCLFLVRPVSGKLMDRRGLEIVVIPGIVMGVLSAVMLGSTRTFLILLLSGVIRSLGQGAAQPSLQAAGINKIGKARSGVAVSTFLLGGDIGQGIAPIVGGWLAERHDFKFLFLFCAGLLTVTLVYFLIFDRTERRKGRMPV